MGFGVLGFWGFGVYHFWEAVLKVLSEPSVEILLGPVVSLELLYLDCKDFFFISFKLIVSSLHLIFAKELSENREVRFS